MLLVTVAVSIIVEPAEATTWPVTVIRIVPPGLSVRTVHFACGAVDDAAAEVADGAVGDDLVAGMLEAWSPCVPSTMTTSSARIEAVFVTRIL